MKTVISKKLTRRYCSDFQQSAWGLEIYATLIYHSAFRILDKFSPAYVFVVKSPLESS